MLGVEEAIELLAVPGDANHDPGAEPFPDALKGSQGQPSGLTALGARDGSLRHPGPLRDIDLQPSALVAQGAERQPDPDGVHP